MFNVVLRKRVPGTRARVVNNRVLTVYTYIYIIHPCVHFGNN